jgi:hypothetical protein
MPGVTKRLLFYTVGGPDPDYTSMLRESLASLRRFHPVDGVDGVDVAVLCDESFVPYVAEELEGLDARIVQTPPNATGVQASRRKIECFDLITDIHAYERVLFLDCDTLVLGSLRPWFTAPLEPHTLYTASEAHGSDGHDGQDCRYYRVTPYTPEQLESLCDVRVFNAGQFMFRPTPRMRQHFMQVQQLVAEHPDSFYEQAAMNQHFNLSKATDDTLLTPAVHLGAKKPPAPPGCLLAHFTDCCAPWHAKLNFMLDFIEQSESQQLERA